MRQFLHGTIILMGMIIGVGLFAVPYVSARAGFGIGLFWIVLLGAVSLLINLYFGEVVAGTPGKHRLVGYADRYLGHSAKKIVTISQTLSFWGAQVAYMLVGGTFLKILFQGGNGSSSFFYTILLFGFVATITFLGLRIFDRVEFWMTWLLLAIIAVILVLGVPHIEASNLIGAGTGAGLFFPYGIILFALSGAAAIPEMWDMVNKKGTFLFFRKKEKRSLFVMRGSIIVGTIVPVIITLLFALVVVGISGTATTEEAFEGLRSTLGSNIIWLGALFGFFAVVTSYLVVALYLKETFAYDFRVKAIPAWIFAVWVPFFFSWPERVILCKSLIL